MGDALFMQKMRAYKYKLRCDHFYHNKRKEETLLNFPANMNFIDWTAFVHYYKEDKMKLIILRNLILSLVLMYLCCIFWYDFHAILVHLFIQFFRNYDAILHIYRTIWYDFVVVFWSNFCCFGPFLSYFGVIFLSCFDVVLVQFYAVLVFGSVLPSFFGPALM